MHHHYGVNRLSGFGIPLKWLKEIDATALIREKTRQEFHGLAGKPWRVVTVAAQFHKNASLVIDFIERGKNGWEMDVTITEHQVLVNPNLHVF